MKRYKKGECPACGDETGWEWGAGIICDGCEAEGKNTRSMAVDGVSFVAQALDGCDAPTPQDCLNAVADFFGLTEVHPEDQKTFFVTSIENEGAMDDLINPKSSGTAKKPEFK